MKDTPTQTPSRTNVLIATIHTHNINNRDDWFQAHAYVHGHCYLSYQTTRHAAFMEVARQLAVANIIKF